MTADTITVEKVIDLCAILRAANESTQRVLWQLDCGELDPKTASEIINESIQTINNWNQ